jgi:cell division protein YceG involved in septum cleavage
LLAAAVLALTFSLFTVPRVSEAYALVRADRPTILTVEEGDDLNALSERLAACGAIRYPGTFRLYARHQNTTIPIPGRYELTGSESYRTLLRRITRDTLPRE